MPDLVYVFFGSFNIGYQYHEGCIFCRLLHDISGECFDYPEFSDNKGNENRYLAVGRNINVRNGTIP